MITLNFRKKKLQGSVTKGESWHHRKLCLEFFSLHLVLQRVAGRMKICGKTIPEYLCIDYTCL